MTDMIDEIVYKICQWDREDIFELYGLLGAYRLACARADVDPHGSLDMEALPSYPIPHGAYVSGPVWAVDARGMCLVGDDACEVARASEFEIL